MPDERILGLHTLITEIERYEPGTSKSGRRAETLIKTDDLRVVLVTMQADAMLQEHLSPGTITIQALTGRFAVGVGDDEMLVDAGSLLTLAAGVSHSVRATEPGAFLLTIAWHGSSSD